VKTPVRVDVPIRIRVDAVALSGQAGELDDALAAATGRALGTASRVLADAGPAGRVEVGAPVLTWTGDGLDQVDAFTRAAAAQRVRRVVADAVDGAGVRRGRRRVATGDPPPVDDPAKVERALRGADAKAAAQAVKAIQRQVQAGDATAFRLALGGLRPDGAYPTAVLLELLRGLAGRHPDRFRALLRPYLTAASSATLRRDPNDLVVDVGLRDDPATALRGAAERLAAAVPAGERLRRELDAALPGLDRVEGLLQAVADRYLDLVAFLRAGVEPTRTDARAKLADLLAGTSRRAGVLVALRRDPRLRKLLPDLEADLREVLRWLSATLDRLRVVDEYLAAYRRMFGLGADRQEEVQVLREVREVLLGQVAGTPLPDRNVLVTLRQQADEAWADWQGRATDRRILRLRLTLADLRAANRELAEYNPYFDQPPLPSSRLDPGASFAGDLRVPFAIRLRETRQTLADAESALWAQEPRRDLFGLILLEQQLVLASVRVQLLALWQRTLALQTNFMFPHDLGSRTDQAGWTREFGALREALATAYAKPDFDHLGSQLAQWNGTLEWLTKDMQRVHRQEAIVGILIDVGAMLAAVGAAKVFGGSAAFSIGRVTLIEAGTFTLASGLGQAIFLGKAPDPSRMVNQLLENFALFGAFKLLGHVVGSAASRTLRKLVGPTLVGEFVAVVGANTALGIGLSALVAKVQSGEWPESWLLLVAGGVLVGAVGAALATPELLRAIRLEGAIGQQLARELTSLHGASSAWTDAVGDAVRLGDLEARWPWLRKEGIRMTRQEIEVWSELARLSNSTLRSLGIAERGQIAQEVTSLRRYLRLLEGMEAVRLPRRLPAPTQLVPTARPSGPGAFEYDPAAVSSAAAAGRLKAAGYTVTDLGGGVLRLTGAGVQGAGVHLLPAGRRPLALPAGRQPLALPAGAAPSDAELAVFAAAEPLSPSDVRRAVAPAHDPGQWTALARAARARPPPGLAGHPGPARRARGAPGRAGRGAAGGRPQLGPDRQGPRGRRRPQRGAPGGPGVQPGAGDPRRGRTGRQRGRRTGPRHPGRARPARRRPARAGPDQDGDPRPRPDPADRDGQPCRRAPEPRPERVRDQRRPARHRGGAARPPGGHGRPGRAAAGRRRPPGERALPGRRPQHRAAGPGHPRPGPPAPGAGPQGGRRHGAGERGEAPGPAGGPGQVGRLERGGPRRAAPRRHDPEPDRQPGRHGAGRGGPPRLGRHPARRGAGLPDHRRRGAARLHRAAPGARGGLAAGPEPGRDRDGHPGGGGPDQPGPGPHEPDHPA
jgi:hypothetical protein